MTEAKVINDLHYNGKTVNERLAADGLLDSFKAAGQAKDARRTIAILEQVAIIKTWATRLATIILEGPNQLPIHLNLNDPRNAGVIRHLEHRNELKFPPCMRAVESPRDPYLHLGSHPDIVEHVWDKMVPLLQQDCRCIVYGTPALVAPRSGIMLAQAFGTQYASSSAAIDRRGVAKWRQDEDDVGRRAGDRYNTRAWRRLDFRLLAHARARVAPRRVQRCRGYAASNLTRKKVNDRPGPNSNVRAGPVFGVRVRP
jgi:hypothetical protein